MPSLLATALCFALDGTPPEWIELIPAGPAIQGQDGRAWINDDPASLVTAFAARNKPLVVDWEHATEHRAPNGLDAPAAGWIDRVESRQGAIWGHVEWTAKAAQQIAAKEYRFLSPVFVYEKQSRRIVALTSAGLTNTPNLTLAALNREECPVSLPLAVLTSLELPASADESAVLAAVSALKTDLATAKNRAETPPLEKFIPRADYDAALSRAANAEQKLAAIETERRDARINDLIETALNTRKISPATKDYHIASCKAEGGIERFEDFLEKTPALLGTDSGLDNKKPAASGSALTETEQAMCRALGLTPEQYRKSAKETT